MAEPRIAIVGLGLIGGSIGLGLRASGTALHIIGHDIDPGHNRLAKKLGAVNESTINLINACENADLIIIATPITAVRETLTAISPHLKPGTVLTDTTTLKEPVLAWAAEILSQEVAFVGGAPLLSPALGLADFTSLQGLEAARPDLFKDGVYYLCTQPDTSPRAVKRVTDMVNLLQARPFYMDPVEHDGMRAAVDGLPILTGLALMQEVGNSPGWREARKIADHSFGMSTASLEQEAEILSELVLLNATHLLPRLDALMQELAQLRRWIVEKNAQAVEDAFKQAASVRLRWQADRRKGNWDEELADLGVTGTFGSLKGALGLGSRRRKTEED